MIDVSDLSAQDDSLLRLGLNRVDCLVIHDLDSGYHAGPELDRRRAELERSGWSALEALRRTGEIAAVGVQGAAAPLSARITHAAT